MEPRHESSSSGSLQRPPVAEPRLQPRIPGPSRPAHSPSRDRRPRIALALLTLSLAACGGSAAAGALATRADSAGVEIVTNTDASWREGDGWQIDPVPALEIGPSDTEDPRYDFLRVNSGVLLPSGEIVLLVAGSAELRFFSPAGGWRRTVGRSGEGPGEMRGPNNLILARDTLFVGDAQLSRISAFSPTGEFLTSWPFPTDDSAGRILPSRKLADGRWLGSGFASFTAGQVPAGIIRTPVRWYRISGDLSTVEGFVAELAGTERVVAVTTGAGGQVTSMEVTTPPIGFSSTATTGPGFLLAGNSESPELRRYTPGGLLTQVIRWEAPAVPIDAALLDRLKVAALDRTEGNTEAAKRVESRFATPPRATVVPYFGGLHLDTEGGLWVREHTLVETDSVHFRIFAPDGQYLGRRSLPPRHRVLDIGDDQILTVWQDDDDLEYVRVYGLRR